MINKIKEDLKRAMKDKDKEKLSALRMLLSTIDAERSKQGVDSIEDFSDDQVIVFINRNLKQLFQEINSLENANRDYSAQEKQKEVLQSYLPRQLNEEEISQEIEKAIGEIVATGGNFGLLMKSLSVLKGKADMGLVSKLAKQKWVE